MDRINGADTTDIGGGRRGFRDESLVAGIIGTEVTAAHLNGVQEELMKVITEAGLSPDASDWSQLWQALKMLGLSLGNRSRRWTAVTAMTITAPPASPAAGDTYLVPVGASGVWASNVGKIAEWTGSAWSYFTPPDGHGISLPDGRVFERVGGSYIEKIAVDVQSGKWNYAVAGGTANALTATLTPAPVAAGAGLVVNLFVSLVNTGAATLNLNGLGNVAVKNQRGTDTVKDDYAVGEMRDFVYDGTCWRTVCTSADMKAGQLFSGSGYQKVPGGLIMQWGAFGGVTQPTRVVNGVYESLSIPVAWPIAFPNVVMQAVSGGSSDEPSIGAQEQAWFTSVGLAGATALVACRVSGAALWGSYIVFGF